MHTESFGYWKSFPALAVGAFVGLLVLIGLRVEYYDVMQYQPNMHPAIAFYFSPFLLVVVLAASLPLETLFRVWHKPSSHVQAGFIGAGYATLLTWWAFPTHWFIFLALNPVVLRTVVGLTLRSRRTCKSSAPLS